MSDFAEIAEIARLRRIKRSVDQMRLRRRAHAVEPGTLFEFMRRLGMVAPEHLAPIAAELSKVTAERIELCFSAPPRHGKSVMLQHYVAWLLILFPHWRIAWVSYGAKFSEEQIDIVRDIYIRAGGALGGRQTLALWTTRAGGSLRASGMDGPMTGRGFHLVIADDLHKSLDEVMSRAIREKTVSGYLTNVWTRKLPRISFPQGTSFVVAHTRWFTTDTIGVLSDPARKPYPWQYINLPAINKDGTALAPEFYSIEDLEREKGAGDYSFSALFMGSPRPIGGLIFGDVATVDRIDPGGAWRYAIGVDFARSARSARADHNVAVVMRRNVESGVVEVVDVRRERGSLTDRVTGRGDVPERHEVDAGFLRVLHQLTLEYPQAPVHFYGARDETLLVSLISRHDRYPVKIRQTLATTKKWMRCQAYSTAWNHPNGQLRVLKSGKWFGEFVHEHLNFAGSENDGETDDQVDAACAAYDALMRDTGVRTRAKGSGAGSKLSDWKRGMSA